MVQRCCVPLCETRVGEVDVKGAKVRFHRIPLIPEKFLKWRHQITNFGVYKPEPELTVNSRICSKHFLREDYITMEEQKPGIAGNYVLARDAFPTIFKWNDEKNVTISRAIPFAKKTELQSMLNGLSVQSKSQEVQCSIEEEKLKQELQRKNNVIRQLLQRLGELEDMDQQGTKSSCSSNEEIQHSTKSDSNYQSLQYNTSSTLDKQHKEISVSRHKSNGANREMPNLTPSSNPSHEQNLINVTGCMMAHSSHVIQTPVKISTQTQTSAQDAYFPNEQSERNTINVQRVSVIKRAGSGSKIDEQITMPPKKRKLNYLY